MRVLQLGPYPPPHGGVQANLSALRAALLMRGSSCSVITLPRSRVALSNDPDIYRPQNAVDLFWLLIRLRYEIAHIHIGGNLNLRLLLLAMFCVLMPRTKSVLSFHSGGYSSSAAGRTARPGTLRGFVLRKLDRIICVNSEIVEMFRNFGVSNDRLRLIPGYVVTAPTETPLPSGIDGFLKSHDPVLLSVGLLEPEYDLPLQIDVLERIREQLPKAGLVMIGSGSLETELRKKIGTKPYAEHVMLCGDVEHSATVRVICESDLLLRTTFFDGDAISVREALHLGTPVIATDNGMRPAGVDLIQASDLDALTEAIKKRLTNPSAFHSQGSGGQENIDAVLSLYDELLK